MRPIARKRPFCPSVAGAFKPFENAGSSPLILTLSFGGGALWTRCDIWAISQQLSRAKSYMCLQVLCRERRISGLVQRSLPEAVGVGSSSARLCWMSLPGAGQEGRWLSKSISFWISGLEKARPGIILFSPLLQLALPHDPLFKSSGDTGSSLHRLEKWHKTLQIKTDP